MKLIKQLPKGKNVFIRTTPTSTYDPPNLITTDSVNTYWLIDANIIFLSPSTHASVGALKPNIVTTQLEANGAIETTNAYFSAVVAMVVMKQKLLCASMQYCL